MFQFTNTSWIPFRQTITSKIVYVSPYVEKENSIHNWEEIQLLNFLFREPTKIDFNIGNRDPEHLSKVHSPISFRTDRTFCTSFTSLLYQTFAFSEKAIAYYLFQKLSLLLACWLAYPVTTSLEWLAHNLYRS